MTLLVLGLALFLSTHLFTSYARGARDAVVQRLGEVAYKGLYSLISLAGFVLIVRGWRAAEPSFVYAPPSWGVPVGYGLMVAALILFAAAYLPAGRIKSWAGHPMALGLILASFAHLLANGDSRSVSVFGAFLAYGIVDRISYRLRGDRGAQGRSTLGDVGAIVGGLLSSYLMVHHIHRFVAGVALDPAHVFSG